MLARGKEKQDLESHVKSIKARCCLLGDENKTSSLFLIIHTIIIQVLKKKPQSAYQTLPQVYDAASTPQTRTAMVATLASVIFYPRVFLALGFTAS